MDLPEIGTALIKFFKNLSPSREDFKNLGWGAARGAAVAAIALPAIQFVHNRGGGLFSIYGACTLSSLVGRVAITYFSERPPLDAKAVKELALSGAQEAVLAVVSFQVALLALTTTAIRTSFISTYALCSILGGAASAYFSNRPPIPALQEGALARITLGALEWTVISLVNLKICSMFEMEDSGTFPIIFGCMIVTTSTVETVATYFFQNLSLNKSAMSPLAFGGLKGFMLNNINFLASMALGKDGVSSHIYILMNLVTGVVVAYFSHHKPLSGADQNSLK